MEDIKKKRPQIRLPAKASIWYIASSVLSRGIGVLGTPLFTRLLTPKEYGVFPLYTTWLSLFGVLCTLEIAGGVLYRTLQENEERKKEVLCSALGVCFVSFGAICTLYFTFKKQVNLLTGLDTGITLVLLLQVLINAVSSLYCSFCRFDYKYKTVAFINLGVAVGSPFISVALIRFTSLRASARIIGGLLASLLVTLPQIFKILKGYRGFWDFKIWRAVYKRCLPLLPHFISVSLILRSGEMIIGRFLGTEALAKYSVAMSLGLSLTMISTATLSALSPWILRKLRAGRGDEVGDFLILLSGVLAILSLSLLCFIPETIKIITTPDYYSAIGAVYILCLTIVPMFISNATVTAGVYFEKTAYSSLASVGAAVLCILLELSLLKIGDYRLIAFGVLVSYLALSFLNYLNFKRSAGFAPFNIKRLALIFLLTFFYAALIYLFRHSFTSRVFFLLSLLPPLALYGTKIFSKIKEK